MVGHSCEWEADPRHVAIITETLGLRRAEARHRVSPGIKRTMDEVNNATDLSEAHARTYRSVCMRINCLAQDRPDILFAAEEMARWMSQPNTMAKRCGRYLLPRLLQRFVTKSPVDAMTLNVDSGHAGNCWPNKGKHILIQLSIFEIIFDNLDHFSIILSTHSLVQTNRQHFVSLCVHFPPLTP